MKKWAASAVTCLVAFGTPAAFAMQPFQQAIVFADQDGHGNGHDHHQDQGFGPQNQQDQQDQNQGDGFGRGDSNNVSQDAYSQLQVSQSVYSNWGGSDHLRGLLNAINHVKNSHALAVLQALLNGENPSSVAKGVYGDDQSAVSDAVYVVEQEVYQNPSDQTSFTMLGKLYEDKGDSDVKAFVNGQQPTFDMKPFIRNGRTLVPVRAIVEALGAKVQWDSNSQTITITQGSHTVQLQIDSNQAIVDGKPVTLDVPAEITGDRTFVPVRFLSEAFGANVQWFPEGQIVDITTSSSTNSNP